MKKKKKKKKKKPNKEQIYNKQNFYYSRCYF